MTLPRWSLVICTLMTLPATASTLVVELAWQAGATQPFEQIRCETANCTVNRLLTIGN